MFVKMWTKPNPCSFQRRRAIRPEGGVFAMNKYEITVIVKPNLEEEAVNAEFAHVEELITRFGGTVEKVDDWGKRRLAYEIQKLNEGFYRFFTVSAEASLPAEVESRIRLRENVLRYLIISVEA